MASETSILPNSMKGGKKMKLRTINQSVEHLRQQDPGCALTPTAIRRKIIAGELPVVMAGNKYLLDIDTLEQHLFTPISTQGKVRPVNVRACR